MSVTTTVLKREMYTEAGAARLLQLAPATLHHWLEGGERRGKTYLPVIREKAIAQSEAGLTGEFALVAHAGDQILLLPPAEAYVQRVVWIDDIASAWRPDSDLDSPVIVDPDVRFGRPSIGGISTEILAEQSDAGVEELAEMFNLTEQQVRWALSYELAEQAA